MDLTSQVFSQATPLAQQHIEELSLLEDVTREANEATTADHAMRYALRRICEASGWEAGHAFRLADDRGLMVTRGYWYQAPRSLRRLRDVTRDRLFQPGEGLPGLVLASGEPQCIADLTEGESADHLTRTEITDLGLRSWIGIPVRVGGRILAVLELLGSQPLHEPSTLEPQHGEEDRFLALLMRIGERMGPVIERERFQRRMINSIWHQQQRVGRELHENVAQQLTGMAMLTESLRQKLAEADRPEASSCAALVESARELQQHTGTLARELFPVEMSAGGLPAALEALAEASSSDEIRCAYEGENAIAPLSEQAAAHLYRIAEEAIGNAVRHGRPRRIEVSLHLQGSRLILRVRDDGTGIHPLADSGVGTGLRDMRCRAAAIGARLRIGPASNRGTAILCELELFPQHATSADTAPAEPPLHGTPGPDAEA